MSRNTKRNTIYFLDGFLKNLPNSPIFPKTPFSNDFILNSNNKVDFSEGCGICLSSIIKPYRPINCNHFFCHQCILKWHEAGKDTCPICRKSFSMIAPQKIDTMKNEIKKTMYYKFKSYQSKNSRNKNGKLNYKCDICYRKGDEDDLILCVCCELFHVHYQCDSDLYITEHGYFCPNCREIFNLQL